jgi:hypothetical protein
MVGLVGYQRDATVTGQFASDCQHKVPADPFLGSKGGDEREVSGIKFCWCPPGQFRMGREITQEPTAVVPFRTSAMTSCSLVLHECDFAAQRPR